MTFNLHLITWRLSMKCKHRYFLDKGLDALYVITDKNRVLVFAHTMVAGSNGKRLKYFITAFEEMDEKSFMGVSLVSKEYVQLYCEEIDTSVIEPLLTVNGKPPELFKDIL